MNKVMLLILFSTAFLSAESDVEILGLHIYGNNDEYRPPIITMDEVLSIEFDVTTVHPPNLQIIFKHASKDWIEDENFYANDMTKNRTNYLAYVTAPNGVYQYTYHYKNSFPNQKNTVEFVFSGNYIFTIVDRDRNDEVLAEGKFIVAEELMPVSMDVENKYYSEAIDPLNQMNFVSVNVSAPVEYNAADMNSILHSDIKTIDIIQNWKIEQPFRIDVDDRNPDTFVDDFMKPQKKFWIRNIPAGNEYRRLDLSSTVLYPNDQLAVLRNGPDVSRFQWQGKPDANGASKLKPFVGANSDYLETEVRLRLAKKQEKNIYLVGGFNNWEVLPEYVMDYDTTTQLYFFSFWIRRGVYDYQYVLGQENQNGEIVNEDWIALEGNDWRTINHLTALVYYNEKRYGGFDRVIGIIRGRTPGGDVGRKIAFPETKTTELIVK